MRTVARPARTNVVLAESVAGLIDEGSTELMPLLMDLHAALAYLQARDSNQDATTCLMIRRRAHRIFEEAVSVLDGLSVGDRSRRYLESRMAVLKTRLMLSGEQF